MLARRRLGRRPAAGVPAALVGGARPRLRRASATASLTSRNSLAPLRALAARRQPRPDRLQRGRLEPDPRRAAADRRAPRARAAPGPRPERRTMAFTPGDVARRRELCVANLHASAGAALRARPRTEVLTAARARRPSGRARRRSSSAATSTCARATPSIFDDARAPPRARRRRPRRTRSTTCSSRGLEIVEPASAWPPERREVRERRARDPPLRPRPGRGGVRVNRRWRSRPHRPAAASG